MESTRLIFRHFFFFAGGGVYKLWRTMMTVDSLKIIESSIFCQSQFVLYNLCMQGSSESYVLAGKMVGS